MNDEDTRQFEAIWATVAARHDTVRMSPEDTLRTAPAPSLARRTAGVTLPRILQGEQGDLSLTGTLGQGGMGVVYLARQHPLDRDVAVKSLRPEVDRILGRGMLLQEAWITGRLEHPNIVPVYALGEGEDGLPMLVMKRIEGVSWQAILDGKARLPERWRATEGKAPHLGHVELLVQVCDAVSYAHSRGILHCDLKPENVMIGAFGEVYVVDWGIAVSLTDDGNGRFPLASAVVVPIGTPAYMSPEQAAGEGRRYSPATDVYALGAILHQIVTGQRRHQGSDLQQVLLSAYRSEPLAYPDHVCPEAARICNRAMSCRPEDRFPDVAALQQTLSRYLTQVDSLQLALQTEERLAELRRSLEQPQDSAGSELYNLFGQCRFGFEQALRTWPENGRARAGLQRCLELMVDHELRREAPEAAAALLAALPQPNAELRARQEALQRRAEAEQAELAALRQEADISVGSRARGHLAMALALLGLLVPLPVAILEHLGLYTPSPSRSLVFGLILASAIGFGLYQGRRTLFRSRANRLILWSFLIIVGVRFGYRFAAFQFAVSNRQLAVFDLSLLCAVTALLAISVDRRLALASAIYFVTTYLALYFNPYAMILLTGANIAALGLIGLIFYRTARPA